MPPQESPVNTGNTNPVLPNTGNTNPFLSNQSESQPPPVPAHRTLEHSTTDSSKSALPERFPGDKSNQPLELLRHASVKAQHAPHLRKGHMPGTDMIDRLDPTTSNIPYHHEGPFDAALLARNTDPKSSPVAALQTSNAETLRATPAEKVADSVNRHVPLDGVAAVGAGEVDGLGERLSIGQEKAMRGAEIREMMAPNPDGKGVDLMEGGRGKVEVVENRFGEEKEGGIINTAAGSGSIRHQVEERQEEEEHHKGGLKAGLKKVFGLGGH